MRHGNSQHTPGEIFLIDALPLGLNALGFFNVLVKQHLLSFSPAYTHSSSAKFLFIPYAL
jgi:hypothetical protein